MLRTFNTSDIRISRMIRFAKADWVVSYHSTFSVCTTETRISACSVYTRLRQRTIRVCFTSNWYNRFVL